MQLFFSSLQSLESFSRFPQVRSEDNACTHCSQNDQWVSHGYVYKQRSIDQRRVVGKRILCSGRYGRNGCGRTRQLYLNHCVPGRQYDLSALLSFVCLLINGLSVNQAYRQSQGRLSEPRHAWRWLQALYARLGAIRSRWLQPASPESCAPPSYRSRRLKIVLPTLRDLLHQVADPTAIQSCLQARFF